MGIFAAQHHKSFYPEPKVVFPMVDANENNQSVTAAMIAIGDELLSGRTQDKNIAYLARFLTVKGIELCEVRIVPDDEIAIISAINAMRGNYDYIFTSGGIGPTHDDITSDAIAKAFGVEIDYHAQAFTLLADHYKSREMEFTKARQKMARIPATAELIENKVSIAPGFQIGNVIVMAGVPSIFSAMCLEIEPTLKSGVTLHNIAIDCDFGEGTIGDALAQIAHENPETSIGSYPRFDGANYNTQIVIRSANKERLEPAAQAVRDMIARIKT